MRFSSYFERTLDEKNRIQIPTEFRSQLNPKIHGQTFVLCPGDEPHILSLYPVRIWEAFTEQMRSDAVEDTAAINFEKWFMAKSKHLDMDSQGRVVLPREHLDDAEMGKEITLSGANLRIDIWRTEDFREFIKADQHQWPDRKKFVRKLGSGWKEPSPSSTA